jgi:competence protein ComEA
MKKSLNAVPFLCNFILVILLLGGPTNHLFAESSNDSRTATTTTATSVNINTASAEVLATVLNGVGEKRAQAIVEYREEHGPFVDKKDLLKVKGIGDAVLAKNSSLIVLQ